MDIAAAITTASATIELVKGLRELDRSLEKSELKIQMADLYEKLFEVKMALIDAREEISEKDRAISTLQEKLKSKDLLVEKNGFHYKAKEDGSPVGLPFCPACLASDGTQIHPAKLLRDSYQCPRCKALYSGLTNYR